MTAGKNNSRTLALLMSGAFVLFGSLAVVGSWGAYWQDTGILMSGTRAEGTVLGKRILQVADGENDYLVEYRFQPPDGQMITVERGINRTLWQAINPGEPLWIAYAADQPKRNFPVGDGVVSWITVLFVSVVGLAFFLFGGAILLKTLKPSEPAAD